MASRICAARRARVALNRYKYGLSGQALQNSCITIVLQQSTLFEDHSLRFTSHAFSGYYLSLSRKMHANLIPLLVAALAAVPAYASPTGQLDKRAFTFPIPASQGSVTYSKAQSISGTFDGGMKTYGRGVSCTGQQEGGDADAVFLLENGATLKNAIIGKDQIEGVHCKGSCTIQSKLS